MEKRRRSLLLDIIATTLWVVPLMAVLAAGGFVIGRDVLGERYLTPTEVRSGRPQPIRILTPEEAKRLEQEQQTPVLTPAPAPTEEKTPRRRATPREPEAAPVVAPAPAPPTETPDVTPDSPVEPPAETPPTDTPAPEPVQADDQVDEVLD